MGTCVLLTELLSMVQDEREVLPPNQDLTRAATATASAPHGIEVAVEFKPVEHPIEPFDNDQPIQCPLPEPSILNVSLTTDFFFLSFVYEFIDVLFCYCSNGLYH